MRCEEPVLDLNDIVHATIWNDDFSVANKGKDPQLALYTYNQITVAHNKLVISFDTLSPSLRKVDDLND